MTTLGGSRGGNLVVVVAFCAGLAIGWFVRTRSPNAEAQRSSAEPHVTARHELTSSVQTQDRPARAEKSSAPAPALAPSAAAPMLFQEKLPARSRTTRPVPTSDPNDIFQAGKDRAFTAADDGVLERLLDAVRISCQLGPGYGAQWHDGRAAIHSSSWQGGLIVYDQIAIAEGAAMMLGSEGATGSNAGEVKVRVAATRAGLHFSSFVPRGDLISTTVFAALDQQRRFIAVMSLHATEFNHNSSQFHGVCDVLY